MTTLANALQRLGLQQYYETFVTEGFDSWDTVLDIQESDLIALDVKLGHRRKLQRAIAEYRGISSDRPLNSPRQDGSQDPPGLDGIPQQAGNDKEQQGTNKEQKRRYRRHPKPDVNGPEKPPSAYVLFSNKVRDEVKAQNLSFTEIARLVGERWQKLDSDEKILFETRASKSKDEYTRLLVDYKKTDDYKRYMNYLADFRAKHGGQDNIGSSDSKRPRLTSDMHSSQDTDEGPGDDFGAVRTGLEHDRSGSISSMSTTSRGGLPQTSLQIVTTMPRMSAELHQRNADNSRSSSEFRSTTRTPVQAYRRRENPDSMDTDKSAFTGAHRYDSPSTDTSYSGQSVQERVVDGESTPSSRRGQSQFNGVTYPSPRGPNHSPDVSLPPINSNAVPRNKPAPWEGFNPEGSRQAFNTAPPIQPSPIQSWPTNSNQFSPISQLVSPGPNPNYGERTLPPIHQLSTGLGYGSSSSAGFPPMGPENIPPRPLPGPESMAFRPGVEQKNEPHLHVNVNANVGDSTNQAGTGRSPDSKDRKLLAQGSQYAGSHNISGGGLSDRR